MSNVSGAPAQATRQHLGKASTLARLALIGVAAVAVAALGWLGVRSVRAGAPRIERIAVLPMENQTGDSSQLFFADCRPLCLMCFLCLFVAHFKLCK